MNIAAKRHGGRRAVRLPVLAALLAVALLIAACGGGSEPAATGGEAPADTGGTAAPAGEAAATGEWEVPDSDITLNFWDSAEQTKAALYDDTLLPEYRELRPNVTINYESISTADMLDRLLVALSTGTGPQVFVLTDWFMPTYLPRGLLDPVPPAAFGAASLDEFVGRYLEGRLEPFMFEGQLYAIPYQMNSQSLFLNHRLFEEAGLDPVADAPQTWEDVAELNTVLTVREGDRVVQKGFEPRYSGDHWMLFFFHHLIYQLGGETVDEQGAPAFNSDAGVEALEIWKDLTTAPSVTQNTSSSPYQDFADEQDAMMFAPPNAGAVIELINPELEGNYSVVPLPQVDPDNPATMMYSFNLVVNGAASDDEKAAAWDFINFVTGQPQLWMERTQMVNPLRDWYETPEAQQVVGLDVAIEDMSRGIPMGRTEHFSELQSTVARAIERVVLEDADPQASLDQAAEEFTRAAG